MIFTEPCEMTVLALDVEGKGVLPQNTAQIADKVLRKTCSCGSFVSGRRILSLVVSEDGFARLAPSLDELYYVVKRVVGADCTLGVSRRFDRLEHCAAARREAVDAARLADGFGVQHIGSLPSAAETA